jgi:ribonuclease PH
LNWFFIKEFLVEQAIQGNQKIGRVQRQNLVTDLAAFANGSPSTPAQAHQAMFASVLAITVSSTVHLAFRVALNDGCVTIAQPMAKKQTHETTARADGRTPDELRPLGFQNHIAPYATGSTLIEWGNTRVICGVTIEENVPRWMKEQGVTGGWLTAEYSMLPYSTLQRKQRDITKGKIDGRSQEIQRLIGRAMRAAIDLEKIGSRTICVDCDVLQADGGTRTAAITGSYVALSLAVKKLLADGTLKESPLLHGVAAVSVGIVGGQALLDLCYTEDVAASVDMNLVMNSVGEFIELQGTGEEATFSENELSEMLALGKAGVKQLLTAQQAALK